MFNFFSRKSDPAKLPFFTDIHCHVIPGVDDGSPDSSTSADLIERMKTWGISRIIASPHITEATFENTPEILDKALSELRDELNRRGIEIELSRSSENRIDDFFINQMEAGNITPLPNNYILVENSFVQEPWDIDKILFDLRIKGYFPILAHPERYRYYSVDNPGRYDALHRAGVSFQINVLSLAGHYGKQEKKTAEMLIEKGYVDFLGTDLHRHSHADSIEAYLTSRDAACHAKALAGHIKNDML